ncbi:MAG: PAS domain-containing sensor histidine kinase [Mariprofundales bacterium]
MEEDLRCQLQAAQTTIDALKSRMHRLEQDQDQDIGHVLHSYRQETLAVENELHTSRQRFRNFFYRSPLSTQVIDVRGKVLMVNSAWEQLWQATLDDLLHYNILQDQALRHLGIISGIEQAFAGQIAHVPVAEYSSDSMEPALSRVCNCWLAAVIYPLETIQDQVRSIALVFLDVSEQKQMEQALVQANSAKTAFLSAMGHEFRTPLNAVLGFAELLEGEELTKSGRKCVQHIREGGATLAAMAEDILDLAAIESGECRVYSGPVLLNAQVEACLEKVAPLAAQYAVTCTVEDAKAQWPMVRADTKRLQHVIESLLSNAIQYNRRDGLVWIALEACAANRLRLVVEDNGSGIDPNDVSQLFVMFSRPGSEAGTIAGSGVGLYVAKRLMELMGGAIGYAPRDGGGSRFWLEIPCFKEGGD